MIEEGEQFIGFLHVVVHSDLVYLAFFAIDEACRGKGYGSQSLQLLKQRFAGKRILVAREALDAEITFNPIMSKIGATIPPEMIAPINHGQSLRDRLVSDATFFRVNIRNMESPTPDPRYKSAANKTGCTSEMRYLATGVLLPNKKAASSAHTTPIGKSSLVFLSICTDIYSCVVPRPMPVSVYHDR